MATKKFFFIIILQLFLFWPVMAQSAKTVEVKKAGTLFELLSEEERLGLHELTVIGNLNSQDMIVLRHMAGAKDKTDSILWTGSLRILDLSKASFVNDKKPFFKIIAPREFPISIDVKYKVRRINKRTGESTVMSHEEYMEELNDRVNSNSSRMLNGTNVGKKPNRIENLHPEKRTIHLNEIDKEMWKEIKNWKLNVHSDYYLDYQEEDSTFYLFCTMAKKKLSSCMFYNCVLLERVVFSSNIEYIGNNCFQNCASLQTIEIPKRVEKIAPSAFKKTPNLKNVYISKKPANKFLELDDELIIGKFFSSSSPDVTIERY